MERRSKEEIQKLKDAPLTPEQQKLVDAHYKDALNIANNWKSDVLPDDEKETIAVEMLIWAAKNFDPNFQYKEYENPKVRKEGRSKFGSYLYCVIRRKLMMTGRTYNTKEGDMFVPRKNRLPKDMLLYQSTIDARYEETGGGEGRYRFEEMFSAPVDGDPLEHAELLQQINAELTEKQREVLHAMANPEEFFDRDKNGTPKVKTVTLAAIGKKLGISRERVRQHRVEIQRVAEAVRARMEAEGNG